MRLILAALVFVGSFCFYIAQVAPTDRQEQTCLRTEAYNLSAIKSHCSTYRLWQRVMEERHPDAVRSDLTTETLCTDAGM